MTLQSKKPRELVGELRRIDELRTTGAHTRKHPRSQIKALAQSLATFETLTPLLIDASGEVISGRARLEACKELGWTEIPTLRVDHLTPEQVRAFKLADNRIAELSAWDDQTLALELKALSEIDLTFEIEATGFTAPEIDLRIQGLDAIVVDGEDPDNAAVEAGPAICKPGDIWLLGAHRIICASCLDPVTYEQLLDSSRAACIFTDPPYNVPIDGHVSGKGRRKHREFAAAVGEMSGPEFTSFLTRAVTLMAEHADDGSVHFICMDAAHIHHLLAAGGGVYAKLITICVWVKNNGGMGGLYRSRHEFVAVFRKGAKAHRNNIQLGRYGRNRTNVWSYNGANTFLRSSEEADLLAQHPTPKPVALVADAILDVTIRGDVVLDAFLGSGSTVIACERTGRVCRGIELDPLYVDLAIRRWQRMTGEDAVLESTGQTFNAIAELSEEAA